MEIENSDNLTVNSYEPAIGERGVLIRGALGNQIWFRVYGPDHEFVDYEITNHDCEIVIIDPHAALIRNAAGDFLDYTTESMSIVK
jgi:hypothetical protein